MVCSVCKQDGHNKRNCPNKQGTPKGEEAETPAQVSMEADAETSRVDESHNVIQDDDSMQEDAPVLDGANGAAKAETSLPDPESVPDEAAPETHAPEKEIEQATVAKEDNIMKETVEVLKEHEDNVEGSDTGDDDKTMEETVALERSSDPEIVKSLEPPHVESAAVEKEIEPNTLPEQAEVNAELDPEKLQTSAPEPSTAQDAATNEAEPVENGHATEDPSTPSKLRIDGKPVDVVNAELQAINVLEHWVGKSCFKITGLEEGITEEDIGKVLEAHCKVFNITFENENKNSAVVRVEGGEDVEDVVEAVKGGLGENPTIKEGGKIFSLESFKPESLLFIGNLKYSIDDEELRKMFEPHGTIERAFVMPNSEGKSKGYGFVEYSLKSQAARARAEMGNINMDGRVLRVEWCDCQSVEDMLSTVLFVDKIPRDLNPDQLEAEMRKLFGEHGKIQGCHIEIGVNNRPRGFAFIDFEESIQAAKAHQALDKSSWMGNEIRVSFANPSKRLETYKSRYPPGGAGNRPQYGDSRAAGYPVRQFNQVPQHGRILHRPYGGGAYSLPSQGRGLAGMGLAMGGRSHVALVAAGRGGVVRTAYGSHYSPQLQGGQYGTRYGPAAVYNQAAGYQYSRGGQYSPYSRPGMAVGQMQPAPAMVPTQILPAQAKARDDLRLRAEARLAPAAPVQTLPDVRQEQHIGFRQGAPVRPSYAAQIPAAAGRGAYVRELPASRPQQTTASYSQQSYQAPSQQASQAQPYHQQSQAPQQQGYSAQQQYSTQQFGQQQQHSQQQPQAVAQSQYGTQAAYQQQQPRQAAVTQSQQAQQQQQYSQQQQQPQYSQQQTYAQQYAQPQQQTQVAAIQSQQQQPQPQQSYAQQQTYAQQYSTQSQAPQQATQSTQGYTQELAQQPVAAQQQSSQQQWTQQQYADYYAAQAQQSAVTATPQPAATASAAQPTDTSYSSYYQQQATQQVAAPEQGAGGATATTASQPQSYEAQWAAYYAANPQAAAQHQQTSSQAQPEATTTTASYDYYNQQQQTAYGTQTADSTAAAATSYYQQQQPTAATAVADVGQKRPAEYGGVQQGAYAGYQQPQQAGYDDYSKRARY